MVTDFIFDGKALSDFGYVFFLEDEEEIVVSNMTFTTIKGARTDSLKSIGYSYEEPYSTTFTIMKNPCVYDNDEQHLTRDDISEMVRWLSQKQFKWFRFIDDNDNDEIWYKAQIKINKATAGDYCYGLQLVVTTNAPYGFTREITKTVNNLNNGDIIEIPINTDEFGEFYPNVNITINGSVAGSKDVSFKNITAYDEGAESSATTLVKNCINGEELDFWGEGVMQFETTNASHDLEKDFDYRFPVLVATPGVSSNVIEIEIPNTITCNVTYKYRGIRKVGFE